MKNVLFVDYQSNNLPLPFMIVNKKNIVWFTFQKKELLGKKIKFIKKANSSNNDYRWGLNDFNKLCLRKITYKIHESKFFKTILCKSSKKNALSRISGQISLFYCNDIYICFINDKKSKTVIAYICYTRIIQTNLKKE